MQNVNKFAPDVNVNMMSNARYSIKMCKFRALILKGVHKIYTF